MTAPNIVNVTSIYGKTSVLNVTTVAANILSNASGSNTVVKVNYLSIANIDGVNPADISVSLFRSSVEYKLAHTVSVPADSSLTFLEKSFYLEEGDAIRLTASADGDLQAVCSYEVLS